MTDRRNIEYVRGKVKSGIVAVFGCFAEGEDAGVLACAMAMLAGRLMAYAYHCNELLGEHSARKALDAVFIAERDEAAQVIDLGEAARILKKTKETG